jgi:hypothetical protein
MSGSVAIGAWGAAGSWLAVNDAVTGSRVTVERVSTVVGANAVFRVMLDDRQVAIVPPGQARTVATSPGDHALYIRIRRRKSSRTLQLHVSDGGEVLVRCGWPRSSFGGLLSLLRFRMSDSESVVPIEVINA